MPLSSLVLSSASLHNGKTLYLESRWKVQKSKKLAPSRQEKRLIKSEVKQAESEIENQAMPQIKSETMSNQSKGQTMSQIAGETMFNEIAGETMTNYSSNGNGSASSTENKFPPFAELIEAYCDRNPKERTKFICPSCGGGNLSVNMKTGKWDCLSEQSAEHRQYICDALNGFYKAEHPEFSAGSRRNGNTKPKTARQQFQEKAKVAEFEAEMGRSAVEAKVEELAYQFDPSSKRGTLAALTVEIAAWAKSGGHDVFGAKMMLKEAVGRVGQNDKKSSVEATVEASSTHSKATEEQVSAAVAGVELLLDKELKDWQELEELAVLQASSGLSKDAFWLMVATQRLERNITAHISVKTGSRPEIDWSKAPSGLDGFIAQINKDSSKRSIDPTAVLWAVLPAVMSVLPKNSVLDMKGLEIPAILWSALLMESGHGKSRAEGLVMEPLRAMQSQELKDFKAREEQYDQDTRQETGQEQAPPEKPLPQRKYLFNVATIASLLEALSHQTLAGSLWLRDEIAGIFKSLGQFSKGDNEEKEVFLAFWDGVSALVDRKSSGSSETADPRLSLFGGLQPGKFRQVFKDADDVDGLAARVMLAFPGVIIDRHKEGEVKLPFLMRGIFDQLQNSNMQVKPVRAAYELWNETQYQARLSAEKQSSGAIAAWMRKMPGHLGRMALALHALECGCNADKQTQELSLETMTFAMELCRYSLESYRFMLDQGTDSQDVESVVSKILGKANQIGGLTAREAVQYIKPLSGLAKENKKSPSSMALDLFSVLVEQGKGTFQQVGKTKKFIPVLHSKTEAETSSSEKKAAVATHPESYASKGGGRVEDSSTVASTVGKSIPVNSTVEITEGNLKGHKATVTGIRDIDGKTIYILKGIHSDFNRERTASQIKILYPKDKS